MQKVTALRRLIRVMMLIAVVNYLHLVSKLLALAPAFVHIT